jgi:hypothetical protein
METPVVCSLIESTINPTAQTLILDFGCGVGASAPSGSGAAWVPLANGRSQPAPRSLGSF